MKVDLSQINNLCLPYMKRPAKIIGAKAVVLVDMENKGGGKIEAGEVVEIFQSFRGYGISTEKDDGRRIIICRVPHHDVRFLKE